VRTLSVALLAFSACAPSAARAETGAAMLSVAPRIEPDPLGGVLADADYGLAGVLTRWRPLCFGGRIAIDPDSAGEGTSEVRAVDVPLLVSAGWCSPGERSFIFPWLGGGATFSWITTEVAGVSRTDFAPVLLLAMGVDVVARWKSLAGLVGLAADLSNERWGVSLRLGLGTFG